jgi:hypothetical protein
VPTAPLRRSWPAQDGPVGHYVATVRMPAEGTYRWRVNQGWFGAYELNPLEVGGPGSAGRGTSWVPPLTVAGISAVVLVAAARTGRAHPTQAPDARLTTARK